MDITALSHEIAETFNDPFVTSDGIHNVMPWWLAPNGLCENNLETGDVIEGLANAMFPITMNGLTYHPQNEALRPWFAWEFPSSALRWRVQLSGRDRTDAPVGAAVRRLSVTAQAV